MIQKQLPLLSKQNDLGKKPTLKKNRTGKWQKQCQPQHIEFVNTNRQICGMHDLGRPHRRPLQAGKRELDFNFLGEL